MEMIVLIPMVTNEVLVLLAFLGQRLDTTDSVVEVLEMNSQAIKLTINTFVN